MDKTPKIALVGNPNCGKTTIFNSITGAHQHVGNYPGVTVDIIEGFAKLDGVSYKIADLPGIYSLTALSEDELVARNYILNEKPDVVIDIVDASTLERQLYLTIQLIELGIPMVIGLNMADVAAHAGFKIDIQLLSELLGVPIVKTVGTTREGIDELLRTASKVISGEIRSNPASFSYGRDLDCEIDSIASDLACASANPLGGVPYKWAAIKLLENDPQVKDSFAKSGGIPESVQSTIDNTSAKFAKLYKEPLDILIAEARYGIISGTIAETVTRAIVNRRDITDRLDSILISPVFGLPVFLAMMYLIFNLTFRLGDPLMRLLEFSFGWLGATISGWWPDGSDSPLRSMLVDGVIGGVGGVVTFLPNILLLFFAIAFLEDSGYMARAAFIMDRVMHRIGLHGKSFIPMLIGLGCSVPAIIGTRILENRRDRLVTILVIPLISCGARLPVYALIIPAFFPTYIQGPILWFIYIIGIALAIGLTKLLRVTLLSGESSPFVMELPPYRMPTFQSLMIHSWERGGMYLKKAGTVILAISILLWWASSYPKLHEYSQDYESQLMEVRAEYLAQMASSFRDSATEERLAQLRDREEQIETEMAREEMEYSAAGRTARFIEPVLKPMGFDWRIGTALIGAIAAKEVFVAQLGIVFSIGGGDANAPDLRSRLRDAYNPLIGFCIMLFLLIGSPCAATVAVARAETRSWKWAALQYFGLTALAWIITALVYQIGHAIGWGA